MLSVKQRTAEELAAEEEKYQLWLQGEGKSFSGNEKTELEPLRRFWTDPNLSENDRFLRDYITKQLWKPKTSNYTVPLDKNVSDSEDEEEVEKQEVFEKKFNFRFEEEENPEVM